MKKGHRILAPVLSGALWSTETKLACSPGRVYPELLRSPRASGWRSLLARAGTTVLVLGVFVSIIAVQRVTVSLVATSALSWSFVVAVQLALGAAVALSAPARRVNMTTALSLWLAGHAPYTLWMLLLAAIAAGTPWASLGVLVGLATIPAVWTGVIVSAFCRHVLGVSRRGAHARAIVHAALVWALTLQYVAWSAGGWFQITQTIARVWTP
jgi:hypothetical protein